MSACINCGGMLARGEANPCLACAIDSNRKLEAAGGGELACRDCDEIWFAADGAECPACGSDAVEPLSKAQERAERAMDGAL